MALFPFCVDLRGKKGLIVGGGALALRKIETLTPFKPSLRVVGPEILPEILELAEKGEIDVEKRPFAPEDLDDLTFLVIATNDSRLNRQIAEAARSKVALINVVDSAEESTFCFPALVAREKLTIAVSTSGASPTAAADLRDQIESALPENIDLILEQLAQTREEVKRVVADPEKRKAVFAALYRESVSRARPLTRNETDALLKRLGVSQIEETRREEFADAPTRQGGVAIVGAGSGDASLITRAGYDAIRNADAILYDELLDKSLLDAAPVLAEKIPVGKRATGYYESQESINALMIKLAREGKRVVRLKGGDPFLFGRGGEEIRAALDADVPFEVVPGVTSALYVPMVAGVPVTYRGLSRSVHIIAASRANHEFNAEIRRCAELKGTIVLLMGLKRLENIARELVGAGMSSDTPVAVAQGGCVGATVVARGTLSDIVKKTREAQIQPPAVVVVGEVARLDLRGEPRLRDDDYGARDRYDVASDSLSLNADSENKTV